MKPRELLADFDCGPGDTYQELLYARLLLSYLADHVYTAELKDGGKLRDAIDFTAWLRELADEAREVTRTSCRTSIPAPQPRYSSEFFPDCGHIHADDAECGFPTGAGGREPCRCERKVPA